MASLRPHRTFDFVRLWKPGFVLSGILLLIAFAGFIVSTVTTGLPLTLGTEFSGGTSFQFYETGDTTEDEVRDAFEDAIDEIASEDTDDDVYGTSGTVDGTISSVQTSTDSDGNPGFIVKSTMTDSNAARAVMDTVMETLELEETENQQVETIGASWGSSVINSSILAFLLSCVAILLVIAIRYGEPRMGVVALVTLFHDILIILGVYAWAGMFAGMEITSNVIAALLAIIGYSLYDTVVVFHRINKNANPQMKMSLKSCANKSVNEIIVRSLNTSITSILPVLLMVILGTDTLLDFAFAMLCGMIIGVYSTIAISAPIYTLWKCRQEEYARLEKKYPYEVVQSTFTTEMLRAARPESRKRQKAERRAEREKKKERRSAKKAARARGKEAVAAAKAEEKAERKAEREKKAAEGARQAQAEREERQAEKAERDKKAAEASRAAHGDDEE